MATKVKKLTDELAAPTLPGTVNNNAVKTAAAGVQNARNAVTNMTYDNFKSGDLYKGLQRDYQQRGQQAMKDTLGQVAARTGGMASSYATSAANQSYNNYMLALEEAARNQFNEEYARKRDDYDMALREYDTVYGEYRDKVGDAWTKYNAEMSAYQDKRNYNYQLKQDALQDERNRVSTQKTALYDLVASGGTPNRTDFPDLTDADYANIVATATNDYNTSKESTRNAELEGIFGAEDFIWGDWDGDGTVEENEGKTFEDLYGGSSYGEEYWQNFYNTKVRGREDADTKEAQEEVMQILKAGGEPPIDLLIDAGWLEEITPTTEGETPNYDSDNNGIPDGLSGLAATMWQNNIDSKTDADTKEAQKDAVDDITARIANGESLENIESEYKIDGKSKTWESVTGMSEAEWRQIFNDNKTKNYTYQGTTGASAIANRAIFGTLDINGQENFDYIYGPGAYNIVQDAKTDIGGLQVSDERSLNDPNTTTILDDAITSLMMIGFNETQIARLMKAVNPTLEKIYYAEPTKG